MTLLFREFATPVGLLTVVCDPGATGDVRAGPSGPVVASGFADAAAVLAGAGMTEASLVAGELPEVSEAVTAYFAGDLEALGRVSVAQTGPPFRRASWAAMRAVPAGRVCSYAELAAAAGHPGAARAAGSACATNAVAPFVPCHRIVRSGGAPGQYAFGLATKAALLRHEGYQRAEGDDVVAARETDAAGGDWG